MDAFSCNSILEAFMKFFRENPNMFKIVQKYRHSALTLLIGVRNILHLGHNAKWTYCCFSMPNLSVFLCCWQGHIAKQNSENALLHYHFNNSYVNAPEVAVYVQCLFCSLLTVHRDCKTTYATSFILRLREIYCPDVTWLNTCGRRDRRRNFCSRIFQRSEVLPTKY